MLRGKRTSRQIPEEPNKAIRAHQCTNRWPRAAEKLASAMRSRARGGLCYAFLSAAW